MPWFFDPDELKKIVEERNLTPKEAAGKADVPTPSMYRWLRDTAEPHGVQKAAKEKLERAFALKFSKTPPARNGTFCPADSLVPEPCLRMTAATASDCSYTPAYFNGFVYRAAGMLVEHGKSPSSMTRALRARDGTAARFRIRAGDESGDAFDVTVFARTPEDILIMLDCFRRQEPVVVEVRMRVKPLTRTFLGFKDLLPDADYQCYAYVVERIVRPR